MFKKKVVTTEEISEIQFPIIMTPFNGVMIPVMLRELTHAQIASCGNFSLIETFTDIIDKNHIEKNIKKMNEYSTSVSNIVRESLVSPTFEEIIKIYDKDEKIQNIKKELKILKERLFETKRGPQRTLLEKEIEELKIWTDFLLPDDFLNFIFCYAMGIDKSDIKKLSEELLLNAAIMAKRGNDNPADHIDGIWPEIQKQFYLEDINNRAWHIYDEWIEEVSKKNRNKRTKEALAFA